MDNYDLIKFQGKWCALKSVSSSSKSWNFSEMRYEGPNLKIHGIHDIILPNETEETKQIRWNCSGHGFQPFWFWPFQDERCCHFFYYNETLNGKSTVVDPALVHYFWNFVLPFSNTSTIQNTKISRLRFLGWWFFFSKMTRKCLSFQPTASRALPSTQTRNCWCQAADVLAA